MSSHPLFLRDSRESETRARMKITLREKRRHTAGEREKWGTTDKAQAFDPSRPTDFGVWSLYPLPNQLSSSNGIPSLIELSLLLSLVNYRGYLLQAKKKKQILIFFTAVLGEELDSVGNTPLLLMPKCCLFQWIFSLTGRLCSGGRRFDWANVIFAAYFTLRGRDKHINYQRLLFMVGMICPLMQEHFLWPLLKSKALQCS